MEDIIKKIKSAVNDVIEENDKFGYVASKGEIAADIWGNYLDSMERFAISQHINATSMKGIEQLRACYNFVQSNM